MPRSDDYQYDQIRPSIEGKDLDLPYSELHSGNGPFLQMKKPTRLLNMKELLPWILCIFLAMESCISFVFLLWAYTDIEQYKKISQQNEFIDPTIIPLEQVRFSGSPQFSPNGTMSHKPFDESIPWPENVSYFGEPSPEIDANWDQLIEWRYFSISEIEAKLVWPDTYQDYVDELEGGWSAGLDVFHTLHCVNAIRKALRPDYYNGADHIAAPHADHCLDAIRQYIQCAGLTTLIPTKFREGIKRNYVESDQVHTCRSFTFLRDWTTNRRQGWPEYIERDQTILDPRKHVLAKESAQEYAAVHSDSTFIPALVRVH